MEEEIDDILLYSSEKLNNLLNEIPDKKNAILQHITSTKYPKLNDFKSGLEWFNVSEPLFFNKDLKGKIVLLDFFTYCCINCMHILPDLKEIENEFSIEDGLVVIGVHSAKFENEKLSNNILSAVQRYNISHPVVNDADSLMWKEADIFSWPTLVLLDPYFNPLVMFVGEGNKENLRLYIKYALEYYKTKNEISNHSLPIKSAYHLLPKLKGPLLFPGKIITYIDENNSEIIAITDTGNHRILLIKNDGTIMQEIGGKCEGFKDGNLNDAEFRSPQGLVFQDRYVLYVADTENHAIRKIEIKNDKVETIIGTGQQGYDLIGGNIGKKQIISSPWDLCLYKINDMGESSNSSLKTVLIIAMAGTHQIWAYFFEDTIWWKKKKYSAGSCVCIAGSGNEENRNNQYPHKAAFAQPSGLALCNKNQELYIADSESSSIRRLSMSDGKVTAVVGGDKNPCNLFAFGDKDGALHDAKLQHVLGIAISKDENMLFLADTYNHKLKKVDIKKNVVNTICGSTAGDVVDGKTVLFNEPSGLSVSNFNNKLYLTDTNNHCIKVITFSNAGNVENIEKLNLILENVVDKDSLPIYENSPVKINSLGGKLILKIEFSFIEGTSITTDAPQKWKINLPNTWNSTPTNGKSINKIECLINVIPCDKNVIDLSVGFYTCYLDTCAPRNFVIRQPVQFVEDCVKETIIIIKMNVGGSKVSLI